MLDWGLGHTTRCIPVLKELNTPGFSLIIAGTTRQISLLKREIPTAEYLLLPGYNIHYGKRAATFTLNILRQIPKIILTINKERRWLHKLIKERQIDLIISDNRPGFYSREAYNIYITHQLSIHAGNRILNQIVSFLHRSFIHHFDECWIPDSPGSELSGSLSRNPDRKIKTRYIGPLSRFERLEETPDYDLTILLSGPEPQRTIFENLLLSQVSGFKGKIIFIRGTPDEAEIPAFTISDMTIQNHLDAGQLNRVLCKSKIILCRAGYTSIMDLAKIGAKAILVPTPGQGEQEYLVRYLSEKRLFMQYSQKGFSLEHAISSFKDFPFKKTNINFRAYETVLTEIKKRMENSINQS